jgi:uncharacterized membrane protein SpoIIM required for sporulation
MVFGVASFLGTWRDAEFSELAGVTPTWRAENTDARVRWWQSLNEANQVGGAAIMTNNIQVMFLAFAFGALLDSARSTSWP